MVTLADVSKTYGDRAPVHALQHVSLTIAEGEMVAIMGPSGSGKSTMLNLIGGLDVPSNGTVVVAGRDLGTLDENSLSLFRRDHVSYVFQSAHLMPTLSAAQNVALPLHLRGVPRRDIPARVAATLSEVGLADRSDHVPDALSGGERQRVALARALVSRPTILLADEPTGNLDSATATQVLELLRRVHARGGVAIVMVTHDPSAASTCQRVVRLRDGRIETPADLVDA